MSTDVVYELRECANWLERRVGLPMRPPTGEPDNDGSKVGDNSGTPRRGRHIVVVACCVAVVAVMVMVSRRPAEHRISPAIVDTSVDNGGVRVSDSVDDDRDPMEVAESTLSPTLDGSAFDRTDPARVDELIGRWSDSVNTFTFALDGTLTFTLDQSCDGTYALSARGDIDVLFGDCDDASVSLTAPIFRGATVYRVGDSLYLDGDAGVFRLDLKGEGES